MKKPEDLVKLGNVAEQPTDVLQLYALPKLIHQLTQLGHRQLPYNWLSSSLVLCPCSPMVKSLKVWQLKAVDLQFLVVQLDQGPFKKVPDMP